MPDEERSEEWDKWVKWAEEWDNKRGVFWKDPIGTIILGDQEGSVAGEE